MGLACLGGGLLLVLLLLVGRPQPNQDHRGQLRGTLEAARAAIELDRKCNYIDPIYATVEGSAFRAHFRRLTRKLPPWNAAVDRKDTAREQLLERFKREGQERGFNGHPYRGDVIARGFTGVLAKRAVAGKLDEALPLDGYGQGKVWTEGYVVTQGPHEGLHIDHDRDWAVDMSGISEKGFQFHADQRVEPVNKLLREAQAWPEALELEESSRALAEFDKEPLLDAISKTQDKRRYGYRRRCPYCRPPR